MKVPPTDLKILERIYQKYYFTFISFGKDSRAIWNKYFIQIDILEIAKTFKVDPDIIMGRLLNLDYKYSYKYDDSGRIRLFNLHDNTINYPLLATVFAELSDKNNKYLWTTVFALLSLLISILVAIFK